MGQTLKKDEERRGTLPVRWSHSLRDYLKMGWRGRKTQEVKSSAEADNRKEHKRQTGRESRRESGESGEQTATCAASRKKRSRRKDKKEGAEGSWNEHVLLQSPDSAPRCSLHPQSHLAFAASTSGAAPPQSVVPPLGQEATSTRGSKSNQAMAADSHGLAVPADLQWGSAGPSWGPAHKSWGGMEANNWAVWFCRGGS